MDKHKKFLLMIRKIETSFFFKYISILNLASSLIYDQFLKSQHSLLIGNILLLFGNIIIHSSTQIFLEKSIRINKTIFQLLKLIDESWLNKPARKSLAIFVTKLVKTDEKFAEKGFSKFNSFFCFYLVFLECRFCF
jgi:hypothetical protein